MACPDTENSSRRATEDGTVSKIMSSKAAEIEIKEAKRIDEIDPGFYYHLTVPKSCIPKITQQDVTDLNGCEADGIRHDPNKYPDQLVQLQKEKPMLLIYKDAGKTWSEYVEEVLKRKRANQSKLLQDFLISAYNVVRGVQDMLEHQYIHNDIHIKNVMYDEHSKRCNLIDFGLALSIGSFLEIRRKYTLSHAQNPWHPTTCPEHRFQFKTEFENKYPNYKLEFISNMSKSTGFNGFSKLFFADEVSDKFNENSLMSLLDSITNEKYENFVNNTLQVKDSYGIGFCLVRITHMILESKIAKNNSLDSVCLNLTKEIRKLAIHASRIGPSERLSAKDLARKYEQCVMDHVEAPAAPAAPAAINIPFNYKDNVEVYRKHLKEMNELGRFNPSNSHDGDAQKIKEECTWISDSVIISEYEDDLRLDLIDFVIKQENAFSFGLNNKWARFEEYERMRKSCSNSAKVVLNIRGPQIDSHFSLSTWQNSKPEVKFFLDCIMLLGSRFALLITFYENPLKHDINVHDTDAKSPSDGSMNQPYVVTIYIDNNTYNLYIAWMQSTGGIKRTVIFVPFKPSNTNPLSTEQITSKWGTSVDFVTVSPHILRQMHEFLHPKLNGSSFGTLRFLIILELVCMSVVETFVPGIVTKLLGIICTSNEKVAVPETQEGQAHVFERALSRFLSKLEPLFRSPDDYANYIRAYEIRMKLSLMRGEVASETEQLKNFRKGCRIQEHGKSHREHSVIAELVHNEGLKSTMCCGHHAQFSIDKTVLDILNRATSGMSESDTVLQFRGMPILKRDIFGSRHNDDKGAISRLVNETMLTNEEKEQFLQDFVCRINCVSENVQFYTQMQVDAITMLDNSDMKALNTMKRTIDFLCSNIGKNTIYIIFENRSLQGGNRQMQEPSVVQENKFFIYGFQLRTNMDVQTNTGKHMLAILVPKPAIFKVLDPISWGFIKELKKGLVDKMGQDQMHVNHEKESVLNKYSDSLYVDITSCILQVQNYLEPSTETTITKGTRDQKSHSRASDYIIPMSIISLFT